MPADRAASVRVLPSITSASASRRRAWSLSSVRQAAARKSAADRSVRVIAKAMIIPQRIKRLEGITSDQICESQIESSIQSVGISSLRSLSLRSPLPRGERGTLLWRRMSYAIAPHIGGGGPKLGLQPGGIGFVADDALGRHVQRDARAAAGTAVDRDFPAMQLHQLLADGEAKAAAAEPAADRGVGLPER